MTSALRAGTMCALVLCAAPVAAQEALKGAALLAEARTALGGEERLRAVKTLDVRGEFKRAGGQNTIEGELQIRIALPDKLRRDEDTSLPGGGPAIVRTEVLNGTEVWDDNSGAQGARRLFRGGDAGGGGRGRAAVDPAQLEAALRRARTADLTRLVLVWLLATDAPVAWIGTAEAPDGRADVLEFTPAGQPAIRLFLDESTHLPLMITWQGGAAQAGRRGGGRGAAGTLQMTLADYKDVNGIRFPHLVTRGTNDQTVEEWTIESYRVNPSFRANVFTR